MKLILLFLLIKIANSMFIRWNEFSFNWTENLLLPNKKQSSPSNIEHKNAITMMNSIDRFVVENNNSIEISSFNQSLSNNNSSSSVSSHVEANKTIINDEQEINTKKTNSIKLFFEQEKEEKKKKNESNIADDHLFMAVINFESFRVIDNLTAILIGNNSSNETNKSISTQTQTQQKEIQLRPIEQTQIIDDDSILELKRYNESFVSQRLKNGSHSLFGALLENAV